MPELDQKPQRSLVDRNIMKEATTYMPKKPARKVSGRKMKVIQLSRHKLVLSSSDWRASRMPIDLYIYADDGNELLSEDFATEGLLGLPSAQLVFLRTLQSHCSI